MLLVVADTGRDNSRTTETQFLAHAAALCLMLVVPSNRSQWKRGIGEIVRGALVCNLA